ncbi:MAG: AAA family ATPase [Actinomycetota bacterium]|nr:AAA family ATPase [Actinomycetota bacterium]
MAAAPSWAIYHLSLAPDAGGTRRDRQRRAVTSPSGREGGDCGYSRSPAGQHRPRRRRYGVTDEDRREYALERALRDVASSYDYILIDCPPSLGILTINGLTAASEVLIPLQAELCRIEG